MTESESEYEKLRRAARELGGSPAYVVEPIEETEEFAEAVRDEAPVAELAVAGAPPPPYPPPAPRGIWESPVSARDVAGSAGLRAVAVEHGGAVWWLEHRPDEDNGCRLIRSDLRQATSETYTMELPVDCTGDAVPVPGGAVAAGSDDGCLYLVRPGEPPRALTAEPSHQLIERYTDLVLGPDAGEVWCVRESGAAGVIERSAVAVPLDGSRALRTLVSPTACLSTPIPSPDATQLAWIEWDPPHMPWDGSRLRVGRLTAEGVTGTRTVLGGDVESVFQPRWATRDSLYVVSDRTRWWNIYQVSLDGALRPLRLSAEEFGWPQDGPGLATYGRLADGRLAVLHGCGEWRLDVLDPTDGTLTPLDLPYTAWQPTLRTGGGVILGVAGAVTRAAALVAVDAVTGRHRVLRQAADDLPAELVPRAQATSFVARDGHDVHVVVYPPRNPKAGPTTGERVPYLLFLPDGPGAQVTRILDMVKVWFTSRGLGVAAVECRGSSGYGRSYREQIYGRWGVADVEDCASVAHGLVDRWGADPARLALRGTGAGGTLALEALASTDLFAAATVYAPITDLPGLAAQGTSAMADYLREVAADSTSMRHASWLDRISRPVLMLHGEDDTVVPVTQTMLLRDALRSGRIPHTCLTFAEEGHSFRRIDTIARALEAELSFYAQALLG